METALTLPLPRAPARARHPVAWRRLACRSSVVIRLNELDRTSPLLRLATPGAALYCSVFPLLQVGLVAEGWGDGTWADAARALVATALYLPLHLRHVTYAARGERPPEGAWTLAVMTVVVVGALPILGTVWLPTFHVIAVSALIVLPRPWSLLAVAAVVVAQAPLALAFDDPLPDAASYYTITVIWRASSVFVPVWLIGAARQLDAARRTLAEEAVVRERLRIDGELRRTLGTALDAIAARGRRASALVDSDPDALAGELQALVDGSRRTLAEARQLVTGYQRSSLRAELDGAVGLLDAAGIEARLVLPPDDLPDTVDDDLRTRLRADTARLLRDATARSATIVVTRRDGRVELELRRDAPAPPPEQVGAP
jgi:two-component system sensor histidine kinase DesK